MNGAGIERMYDLRETDTNNLSHVYLEAEHFEGAAAPTLKDAVLVHQYHTSSNTYEMAYFGGYGSGVAMKFLNPDGKAYVTRLYETAAVYALPWGITDFGFLFGNCKTTTEHTLWNEGNALPWPDVWGPVSGDVAVWLDGVSRDRNTGMTLPNGIHVLQERYNTLPTNENLNNFENALFSTKALASSKGGQFVGEVMVFSSRLTDVERVEVQNYLTAKWNLDVTLAPARVELNAGTTLEVDTAAGTTNKANLLVTGEGTLVKKGEGTLWYRPEAREAVTPGKVDLQEGAIIASGAFTLKATPGMKVTAAAHGNVDYSGTRVTKGSASAANTIEKEGTGYVAIDEIPAGTRRLSVKAGTLGIRSYASTTAPYEVEIPNGRFEDWGINTGRGNIHVSTVGGAWSSSGSSVGFYNFDDWTREGGGACFGAKVKISDFGFDKYPPLDGRCVLMLKVCNNWAEVQVPFSEGGEYELCFLLAGRSGSKKSQMRISLFDANRMESEIGKTYLVDYNVWTPQIFRFRVGTAGTYGIRFHHLSWPKDGGGQQDFTLLVNGLHLYRTGDGGAGWKIPFGDCETTNISEVATAIDNLTGVQTLPGWTYDTTVESTYSRAGLATARTYTDGGRRYGPAFNASHAPFVGDRMVCIRRNGGWARAEFTPPAGTWYLRAHTASFGAAASTPNKLLASVTMGDAATDLGVLTLPNDWQMRLRTWPTAFTADGATPVTLTVTANCMSGMHGAYLDNFELVADYELEDGELVKNGDFESPTYGNAISPPGRTGWTWITTSVRNEETGKDDTWASNQSREYGRNDPDAFGFDHGSGDTFMEPYALTLPSVGGFYQDISFPRVGWYRLAYLTKGRSNQNVTIPLVAYLADVATGSTNYLDRVTKHTRGVYQQRSALFRVDAPCTRRLAFIVDGTVGKNGYVCVDDVSIRAVEESVTPTFGTGANGRLSIDVAADANLHLDYVGTNTVTCLRVDGVSYDWGVIDRNNCPAITGPGALLAKPYALHIILR